MTLSPVKIARESIHTASFQRRLRIQEAASFLEEAAMGDAAAALGDLAAPADINEFPRFSYHCAVHIERTQRFFFLLPHRIFHLPIQIPTPQFVVNTFGCAVIIQLKYPSIFCLYLEVKTPHTN